MEPSRDLLFISYAWEDGAVAEWLTLKLTALGYRVWCDRFEMLGGEPWPADVDDAIRNHAFRLLHLVSKHSLHKPNPTKERELALALGRERGIPDFLIPLNLDGTKPSELPWRLIDVTYIPFQDWGAGLQQLLKQLDRKGAPRSLGARGVAVAATAFLPVQAVCEEPEIVYSNCLPFVRVPKVVRRYQFSRPVYDSDSAILRDAWAFRLIDDRLALAFEPPPDEVRPGLNARDVGGSV
ncbi:MAG: toll/interleukin-1 receptor domain-containing protein, partial [Dehalococcoidia bacterium]